MTLTDPSKKRLQWKAPLPLPTEGALAKDGCTKKSNHVPINIILSVSTRLIAFLLLIKSYIDGLTHPSLQIFGNKLTECPWEGQSKQKSMSSLLSCGCWGSFKGLQFLLEVRPRLAQGVCLPSRWLLLFQVSWLSCSICVSGGLMISRANPLLRRSCVASSTASQIRVSSPCLTLKTCWV